MNQKLFSSKGAFRFKRFDKKAYSAFNSMHKLVNIGVLTGCVLTVASIKTSYAQTTLTTQQEKITEGEIEEVTVTASRVELNLNQASRLVTVITQKEIEQAPVSSIQDLLNYSANIDVLQRGGHGVQADISIRGGSFDQTAILLNGINLSSPHTGHYSFDIPINLSDIERIEIIHGPSSLTYGASAFSGGINIITKKNPDYKLKTSAQAGGHSLYGLQGHGVIKTEKAVNQISLGYNSSDGYMKNSDYDIFNFLWQTNLRVEDTDVNIQAGYNDKRYGANTFYSAEYPNQYDKTDSYFFSIQGKSGTTLKFIPQVYWSRHNDCFQLYRDGTANVPEWYTGHNYHRSDVLGANLNLQYTSKLGITSLGSEFRNESILSNVLGKEMKEPQNKFTHSDERTNVSFALEHNILLRKFTFSVGLLANYNTATKSNFKFYPAINTNYRITNQLKAYASFNKATRMPTFTDLYYTTATHIGNSDLKPETSEAFELGFKYHLPFIRFYLAGYMMKGKNMIDWVKPDANSLWESRNITEIDKKGIEVETEILLGQILPKLDNKNILKLGYARLHQNKKAGELISNYALNYLRDKFTVNLTHTVYKDITASWNFRWQKRIGIYTHYINREQSETRPYPYFSVLDVRVHWKIKDFTVNLDINNLYDTHYFDLGNIPQAGFWMMGGITYTLK